MKLEELKQKLDGVPTGDPEYDHIALDQATVDFVRSLIVDKVEDMYEQAVFLVHIWDTIEELWYA